MNIVMALEQILSDQNKSKCSCDTSFDLTKTRTVTVICGRRESHENSSTFLIS